MYRIQLHWIRLLFIFLFLAALSALLYGVWHIKPWVIIFGFSVAIFQYVLLLPSGKRHVKLSGNGVVRFVGRFIPGMKRFFVHPGISEKRWEVLKHRAINQSVPLVRDTLTNPLYPGYECLWNSNGRVPVDLQAGALTHKIGNADCLEPYRMNLLNFALPKRFLAGLSVRALSESARIANCAIRSTKDGITAKLMNGGGDLVWQIKQNDPLFRKENKSFDEDRFQTSATRPYIKMIELKLPEKYAAVENRLRGDGLLFFVMKIRSISGGKPIGINLLDANIGLLPRLCTAMSEANVLVDFITIEETHTHEATLLMDAVGFARKTLAEAKLSISLIASGQFVTEFEILKALAYGANTVYSSSPGYIYENGPLLFGKPDHLKAADFHKNTLTALQQLMENAGFESQEHILLRDFYRRVNPTEIHNLKAIEEATVLSNTIPTKRKTNKIFTLTNI